ncbi:unnamed protein product [Rhodiola kirilowii]
MKGPKCGILVVTKLEQLNWLIFPSMSRRWKVCSLKIIMKSEDIAQVHYELVECFL